MDEIMQWYDRFIESVRQIAMSAEEQIKKLDGTVITDEIALDFSDIGMNYAVKLLNCNWISQDKFVLAEKIEKKLGVMSSKKELWNNEALIKSKEWKECREMGKKLLDMLGE